MKIPVDKLFGPDIEAIEVDQLVRPTRGELGVRYPHGVHVSARITQISHGVYMEGEIDGEESEVCVRCLEPFSRHVHVTVEEAYSEDVLPSEALTSDVAPLVARAIDLDDLVEELLEVDEPLAAVCSMGCRGICPNCGNNRNVQPCSCTFDDPDPRLAGLAKLLSERED